jgi:carbon-monoxide dehydrogenase medium subunit
VSEVRVQIPSKNSGGCYLAFKRCAPVYASAGTAVQLTMDDGRCRDVAIYLGCVGLTPVRATSAEAELRGHAVTPDRISKAADAARSAADPQPDMRGSAEYKRALVAGLLQRAIDVAVRRACGERVEVSHIYA